MIANVITPPPGAYGTDVLPIPGTIVAPAATQNISSQVLTAKEKPATWRVRVWYGYTAGAPAAAEINNWRIVYGNVVFCPGLVAAAVLSGSILNSFECVFNDGGASATLALQNIGAATAGVSYSGLIEATRLS